MLRPPRTKDILNPVNSEFRNSTTNHPGELGWFHGVIPLVSRKPPSNSVERCTLHHARRNVHVLSVHGHTAQVLCISRLGLVLTITYHHVTL